MEEKERFELLNDNFIYDKKLKEYVVSPSVSLKCYIGTLADLLNQQDKEIKELKSDNVWLHDERERLINYSSKLIKNNKQLKQSQNQLAIEKFEKIKNYFDDSNDDKYNESEGWIITNRNVVDYVNNQIKSLKGEE